MSDADGMAGPGEGQSVSRRPRRDRYGKTIVFVAPPGTISHALACAIEAEFPWLSVERVAEPGQIGESADRDIQLIVLAHQVCCSNKPAVAEIARKYKQAGMAVMADRTGHFAFRDLPESLPMRGVLPMNVNLDIWLSILRIMLHGGSYLPAELILPSAFTRSPQGSSDPARRVPPQGAERSQAMAPAAVEAPPFPVGSLQAVDVATPGRRSAEDVAQPNGRGACDKPALSPLDVLTVREYEVLHMVSRGHQNKIIAAELDLAENTVKIHLHNIIRKLAVSNRTQAAALYLEDVEAGRLRAPETAAHVRKF